MTRSLIDELCEGDHDHRPAWLQEALRILANDPFLETGEQLRRAHLLIDRAEGDQ
jgi:hypothetical protein